MEIQVKRLRDTLAVLVPVIPKKTVIESLGYVRLGEGSAVANDLEIAVAIELPGADEDLLLPGKDALGFLKYTPGASMAQVTANHSKVTITAGDMETSFAGVPRVDDFPPLPEVKDASEGVLNGDVLVRTLVALAPYASSESTKPVLSGVYLTTGDEIEIAAADGYRLAWQTLPGRLIGPSMIIPHKGVDILEHLWKRSATPDMSSVQDLASLITAPRLIRLNWGEQHLKLGFDAVTLIIHLINGSFPDYHQLIPKETQPPVTVDAEDMERALAQVAPVAKDNRGIVRLRWEGEKLQVSAIGDEKEITVPIRAQFTEPGRTALNIQYLREYFRGRSGMVSIQTQANASGPVLFTYKGQSNTLVMPMNVERPVDEAAAATEAEVDAEVDAATDELEAKIDAEAEAAEAKLEEPAKKKRKAKVKK